MSSQFNINLIQANSISANRNDSPIIFAIQVYTISDPLSSPENILSSPTKLDNHIMFIHGLSRGTSLVFASMKPIFAS